jgi:hypothetical protein
VEGEEPQCHKPYERGMSPAQPLEWGAPLQLSPQARPLSMAYLLSWAWRLHSVPEPAAAAAAAAGKGGTEDVQQLASW